MLIYLTGPAIMCSLAMSMFLLIALLHRMFTFSKRKFGRCRFVGRRRHRAKKISQRKRFVLTLRICAIIFFAWCFLNTDTPCRAWKPRFLSRKALNKLMHIKNGNTAQETRARWETSEGQEGLRMSNIDEITIPESHTAVCFKTSEVSDGATGFAFCNQVFLQNKLRVTGGHFLVLVVPGRLQGSLKQMVNDTKPGLLAKCHECFLTLFDPVRKVNFPRACTLINLGTNEVKPAKLDPTITLTAESTTTVLLQAFQNKAPEEWNESCYTAAQAQRHVLAKVAKLLSCPAHSIEKWGYVYRNDQAPWLKICVRVPSDKASGLYNCKDSLCFFRQFLTKDQTMPVESNVTILWSSCTTIAAMKQTAGTLQGILGYVANQSSLGVRVQTAHLAAARQALSRPNPRFTSANQHIALAANSMKFQDGHLVPALELSSVLLRPQLKTLPNGCHGLSSL